MKLMYPMCKISLTVKNVLVFQCKHCYIFKREHCYIKSRFQLFFKIQKIKKRQYRSVVSGGQFRERCPQFKLASVPNDTDHMQATK